MTKRFTYKPTFGTRSRNGKATDEPIDAAGEEVDVADKHEATAAARRKYWADKITASWNRTFESIFETGGLLKQSQDDLDHGEWLIMCRTGEVPFHEDKAQRLMRIAEHKGLANPDTWRYLPMSWRALYELSRLSTERFDDAVARGDVRPDMRVSDAVAIGRGLSRRELEEKQLTEEQRRELIAARNTYVYAIKKLPAKDRSVEAAKFMQLLMTPMAGLELLEIDYAELVDAD